MAKNKKFGFSINTLINWGASVVIVGLMFKILHFKGGEWMIGIGLGVEAILFFIMGFLTSEKDVDWTRVYPELEEDYRGDRINRKSKSHLLSTSKACVTESLDKLLQDAKIDESLIASLGNGLRDLSEKVSELSKVSDTAYAANQFTDKLNAATSKATQLSTVFEKTAANLQAFNEASSDMQQFQDQVAQFNKNLTALNAIYGNMLQAMGSNRL